MTPRPVEDLRPLALPGGTRLGDVARLHAAVAEALAASAPGDRVLLPHDPGLGSAAVLAELRDRAPAGIPAGTAAVLRTSGSTTGTGHLVALRAAALVAGARATETALSGPGRWILAVPAHHVAGFQLLVRSVVAGTGPVVVDTSTGFDPSALVPAARTASAEGPGYLSLVPTQLLRVLRAGEEVREALRGLSAILVGGAATTPEVLAEAREAGLPVRTTYGMTETGGGCVYDGVPLPGVRLRIAAAGRIEVAGPVLASGYLDDPGSPDFAVAADGTRWLRTRDRGELSGGRLRVLGRLDEVIVTGGVKVEPAPVERVLASHPDVSEALVVGLPDEEWGQAVTAVLVPAPGASPSLPVLRELVRERLGAPHAPRRLLLLAELPHRGPGKPDRLAAARLAAEAATGSCPRDLAPQRPRDGGLSWSVPLL